MNLLLLSEHYSPKIAGTVSYAKHLMQALAKKEDLNIYFLCPAKGKMGEISAVYSDGITFINLGVNEDSLPLYAPEERKFLVEYVSKHLIDLVEQYQIDVLHLLYGFFLAESIDTQTLKKKGVKTVFTVHNIPPQECSISWSGDVWWRKWKDDVRKIGVRLLNHQRLKKQKFDAYLTPSEEVKTNLLKVLPKAEVIVTPHGGAELIERTEDESTQSMNKLKILTAGGIVPHKRQDWIPEIAAFLKLNGIDFEWNVVGPQRNAAYVTFVKKQIEVSGLNGEVKLLGAVSNEDLKDLYSNADFYIQLSREEGFCMTVLDAVAYGLPVMATPVGAIPEMLEKVEGVLLDPYKEKLKKIILHYITINESWGTSQSQLKAFIAEYNWESTAHKVLKVYHS